MILALNTAEKTHEMTLLTAERILLSEKWLDDRSDVENLTPRLQKMLAELELTKEEITDIIIVRGPGSFTSLRVGIAFANALAEGLSTIKKVALYSLTTFELLALKAATRDPLLIALHAGGLDAGVAFTPNHESELKVGPLSDLLAKIPHGPQTHAIFELPETLSDEFHAIATEKKWTILESHELQTFGEALLTSGLATSLVVPAAKPAAPLTPADSVEPLYLKSPHITISLDPWKKVST
ncbi:MAG: tRNA (adenosine(37)-N6)-threonylcarbamoyltransferase complex dimerization subunit type 1 TsaB [Candidatus Gracilibacteria bacterium]|jgi:tRNA threonylcarbamoyl adenosine modification protein YeaZ